MLAVSSLPAESFLFFLLFAGPSDTPPAGLAYQLLNAGEILALCSGHRGVAMVQVCITCVCHVCVSLVCVSCVFVCVVCVFVCVVCGWGCGRLGGAVVGVGEDVRWVKVGV